MKEVVSHLKRSESFSLQVRRLAEKVLSGTLDAQERADLAHILRFNTTDSQCLVKSADDEPIFVLRGGGDPVAAHAVQHWGIQAEEDNLHADKINDAYRCAKEMREFAARKAAE